MGKHPIWGHCRVHGWDTAECLWGTPQPKLASWASGIFTGRSLAGQKETTSTLQIQRPSDAGTCTKLCSAQKTMRQPCAHHPQNLIEGFRPHVSFRPLGVSESAPLFEQQLVILSLTCSWLWRKPPIFSSGRKLQSIPAARLRLCLPLLFRKSAGGRLTPGLRGCRLRPKWRR